jgi:hypothetical protein
MASVLEIVRGISQAMSNTHDGALDENGDPIKIGLRREEEVPITDKRVVDGFSIRFLGEKLCIYYNSEVTMKEVHANGFENDINGYIDAVTKHLKKQYKVVTGEALNLTKEGESDINVQNMSRIRSWVVARQDYKVGNYGKEVDALYQESSDKLDNAIKDILSIGKEVGEGAKKNKADSRKKGEQ